MSNRLFKAVVLSLLGVLLVSSLTLIACSESKSGAVSISTAALSNGVVGAAYSDELTASGGDDVYVWAVSDGSLPEGLALDPATGVVSGTPSKDGAFSFTIKVTSGAKTPATAGMSISISPEYRVIADMYGDNITVPTIIDRVISTGPVETQLIYMLAPEKLAGVNMAWVGDPSYVLDQYRSLPNIGNASSKTFNFEAAIATRPDIVLEGKTSNLATDREKFGGIPVVGVNAGSDLLTMYQDEITFVGDLLGVPEQAAKLVAYYNDAMAYVNGKVGEIRGDSITSADNPAKVRVYYAEGTDGLQTDAKGSWHTNLLWFCGGANVADVAVSNTSQAVTVSMEQILAWDEAGAIDMIVIGRTSQSTTREAILASSTWQTLSCVRLAKVYVRPDNPTSWFDGPPGYGQILGMYWMVRLLYPDRTYDLDLSAKVKEFYSSFLHYELTDAQVASLLANAM